MPIVSVDEMAALAVVLDVPVTALLVDHTQPTTPLTAAVSTTSVGAILWLIGEVPVRTIWGPWNEASVPVRLAQRFHRAQTKAQRELWMLKARKRMSDAERKSTDETVTQHLWQLSTVIAEMRGFGMAVPEVEQSLVDEGRRRGLWGPADGERWRELPDAERERLAARGVNVHFTTGDDDGER